MLRMWKLIDVRDEHALIAATDGGASRYGCARNSIQCANTAGEQTTTKTAPQDTKMTCISCAVHAFPLISLLLLSGVSVHAQYHLITDLGV